MSWMNVRMQENLPEGCNEIRFMRSLTEGDEKLRSWNEAVDKFLETGDDWLWSTHNDVQFDHKTLQRLMSWDKPLISALIFMRQTPSIPHIWKSYEGQGRMAHRIVDTHEWFMDHPEWIRFGPFVMDPRPDDALVEISFTSTSCTLIHRSVLEKMERPWFTMDGYCGGGEDRRFFENAAKAGIKGYVDRSCVAGHLVGDVPSSAMDFMIATQSSEFKNTGEPGQEFDGNSTG
jgi:predicted peroxiredoxin